jgi:hypothetical protein
LALLLIAGLLQACTSVDTSPVSSSTPGEAGDWTSRWIALGCVRQLLWAC